MKVSDRLTDIAELIVQEALVLAWAQIDSAARRAALHRRERAHAHVASMIVVAYGKLGGLELGYGSDLDLVFLHDSSGEAQRTDGAQPIDNTRVLPAARAAPRAPAHGAHVASGRLYEVDTRLRPGRQSRPAGAVARGISRVRVPGSLDLGTSVAAARPRNCRSTPQLCEQFEGARIEVLRKAVTPRRPERRSAAACASACARTCRRREPGQFDLKQDAGGVADLEFLVQFWMLKWADRYPEIVTFSDNIRQLESLASGAIWCRSRGSTSWSTPTARYRQRLHRLSLDGAKNVVGDDEFVAERRGVVEVWEEVMREAADLR